MEKESEEGAGVSPSSPEEWPESPTEEGQGLSPGELEPGAQRLLQGFPEGHAGAIMVDPFPSPLLLSYRWVGPRHRSFRRDQSLSQVMSNPRAPAPNFPNTCSLQSLPTPGPGPSQHLILRIPGFLAFSPFPRAEPRNPRSQS